MARSPGLTILTAGALLLATACSSQSSTVGAASAGATAAPAPAATIVVSSSPAAASPATAPAPTVNMTDANLFQPTTLTVARGTTLTWVNTGQTPHTVTDDPSKASNPADAVLPAGAQAWDSGNLNGGARFTHTFDTPGQYTYFCIPHESLGMLARITVTG